MIIILFIFFFFFEAVGGCERSLFCGCHFFAGAIYFYSVYIYLFQSRLREVTSQKMTTKFSYRKRKKARSVSCAVFFQGYLFESFRRLLCFCCPSLITWWMLNLFFLLLINNVFFSRDSWGRRNTKIVAIDAHVFRCYTDQLEAGLLKRELNKVICKLLKLSLPLHLQLTWGLAGRAMI